MTNLLRTGMETLSSRRQSFLVDTFTYSRGSLSATISAQIATTAEEEIDGGAGITMTAHKPDFIMLASQLVLEGTTITKPEQGDLITNGSGQTFKVVRALGEKEWRWTTAHRIDIRIHTEEILST